MRERIEVTVPLAVVGEAPGVEEGGVLQQVAYEIQVESLPGDIPQEITIDVSSLGMHENLNLGDLTLPEGVTLLSEPEEVAVTVTAPTEITEEEMEAAGIVEEPTEEEVAAEEAAEFEEAAEGEEASEEDAPKRAPRDRTSRLRLVRSFFRTDERDEGGPIRSPSSSASVTPGAPTNAPVTTLATWSPTSSRSVTTAPGARGRRPKQPLCRLASTTPPSSSLRRL